MEFFDLFIIENDGMVFTLPVRKPSEELPNPASRDQVLEDAKKFALHLFTTFGEHFRVTNKGNVLFSTDEQTNLPTDN